MLDTRLPRAALALGVSAAAVLAYTWLRSPPATRVKPGERVPVLELATLGADTPTRLASFRGRTVLLTMFMSSCPLCDRELPRVERLHREFLKRGLVVLGVGVD